MRRTLEGSLLSLAVLGAVTTTACSDSLSPGSKQKLAPASETNVSVSVTSSLVLNETGYSVRVMAEDLDLPQGTVELGNGEMFVNVGGQNIVRVLPNGSHKTFATLPVPSGANSSVVVDLLFDPGRGLFASVLATPITLASPVWRVGLNGHVTQFAAVPGAQSFLALDGVGRVYVTQAIAGVMRVEQNGSLTSLVTADPMTTRLRGIALDAGGRLYVLSTGESPPKTRIRRFDLTAAPSFPVPLANGVLVTDALPVTPATLPVEDLLFWPRGGGDLFTVDAGNVYRVTLDGAVSVFASGLLDSGTPIVVNSLALSGAGDLLVTEYAAGRVTRICPKRGHC